MNKTKKIILALVILILVVMITGAYKKVVPANIFNRTPDIGQPAASAKALDFVKNTLVQPGTDVSLKSISEESGLYKVILTIKNQDITAYITKDGTTFFPQAMNIADVQKKAAGSTNAGGNSQPAPTANAPKSDTPDVKLFVMSYCPFGTQMEKGILPALDALKSKIKFTLEFVDYSMHNDKSTNDRKELDENMRQYCIQKNQPDKLDAYLTCFLKSQEPGQETSCMTQAGITAATISSCMSQTDTQFDVTKDFNDQSTYQGNFPPFNVNKDDNDKYGVQGSPTLVINDAVVQPSGRDSASLLKTICSAFNNPPSECNTQLDSTAPSPGFGGGTASGGSNANCGN